MYLPDAFHPNKLTVRQPNMWRQPKEHKDHARSMISFIKHDELAQVLHVEMWLHPCEAPPQVQSGRLSFHSLLSLCSLHSPDTAASLCTFYAFNQPDSAPEHYKPIMSLPSNFKPHSSLRSADVSAIRATLLHLLRPVLLQLFIQWPGWLSLKNITSPSCWKRFHR